MCKIVSVTNRQLCREDFLTRLSRVAHSGVDVMILREKDLPPESYRVLARQALEVCRETDALCVLHTYADVALELGCRAVHLPLPVLRQLTEEQRRRFTVLGASCHSLEDVEEAARLGCTYVTLGHIFATDCKPGLPPRGLELLRQICAASPIPVYAIGGIGLDNARSACDAGAAGVCLMSGLMRCPDPAETVARLRETLHT